MPPYRIGLVVPSSNTTMETEVPELLRRRAEVAPEDFTFHSSRVRLQQVTEEELTEMVRGSDRCALELSDAGVDVMAYACLVAIMSQGPGFHVESERRLAEVAAENGGPAPIVSSAGALVRSIRALGFERVAVVAPYMKPLTKLVVDYIEHEASRWSTRYRWRSRATAMWGATIRCCSRASRAVSIWPTRRPSCSRRACRCRRCLQSRSPRTISASPSCLPPWPRRMRSSSASGCPRSCRGPERYSAAACRSAPENGFQQSRAPVSQGRRSGGAGRTAPEPHSAGRSGTAERHATIETSSKRPFFSEPGVWGAWSSSGLALVRCADSSPDLRRPGSRSPGMFCCRLVCVSGIRGFAGLPAGSCAGVRPALRSGRQSRSLQPPQPRTLIEKRSLRAGFKSGVAFGGAGSSCAVWPGRSAAGRTATATLAARKSAQPGASAPTPPTGARDF